MRAVALLLILAGCVDAPGRFASGEVVDPTPAPEGEDREVPREVLQTLGRVGIWSWELPNPDGSMRATAHFSAHFWQVFDYGEPTQGGVSVASPDGPERCAATTWTAEEAQTTGGVPAQTADLSAGALRLGGPSWELTAQPILDGERVGYGVELNPDHPIDPDAPYALEADGATFPAFVNEALLRVPEPLHLLEPTTEGRFELGVDDLRLSWEGGSDPEIWIELHTEHALAEGNNQVTCRADNDGDFTIDGALLTGFPPGAAVRLVIGQPRSGWFEVDGRRVDTGSGAAAEALGTAIP